MLVTYLKPLVQSPADQKILIFIKKYSFRYQKHMYYGKNKIKQKNLNSYLKEIFY